MNTILYTKPNCVQCDATKRALAKSGIPHEVVDITAEPDARDHVLSLGYL
ncbi:MAG: NrdH-redoxin, partial [Mycobacterium sp.]